MHWHAGAWGAKRIPSCFGRWGGVAYVNPPHRALPVLWTIAAGPLVNVILLPILYLAAHSHYGADLGLTIGGQRFMGILFQIDFLLLIFNMMPVYPLDGGQILMSLLWLFMSEATALRIAAIIGIAGGGAFFLWALQEHSTWSMFMAIFVLFNAWQGFRISGMMKQIQQIPRRRGLHCPHCRANPPLGPHWTCFHCRSQVDLFENHARCPSCGADLNGAIIPCIDCRKETRIADWFTVATVDPVEVGPSK